MADIAGISGSSNAEIARSSASQAQQPDEEELRAREAAAALETSTAEAANGAPATNGTGTTDEASTDQSTTGQGEREASVQVTLSAEAQQIIGNQAASSVDEFAPANDTNQEDRDEDRTGVVNGNQNNQSQQTRALGQIVDQFA